MDFLFIISSCKSRLILNYDINRLSLSYKIQIKIPKSEISIAFTVKKANYIKIFELT